MKVIGCIVEGHGDASALPVLVRRIAGEAAAGIDISARPVFRVGRGRLLKPGELERYVELIAMRTGPDGRILILLDADQDCPAQLAPRLLERARRARGDRMIGVVLAKVEFEAWFLACASSLGQKGILRRPQEDHSEPESVRDAKGWLAARLPGGYSETLDQPALAAVMDITAARKSPSFDKFVREVAKLLQ